MHKTFLGMFHPQLYLSFIKVHGRLTLFRPLIHNSTNNTFLLLPLQYHTPPHPLPTNNPLPPIEPAPQPLLPTDNLPLQKGEVHNSLTILRPNPRQPNALPGLLSINQDVCTILMAAYMRDEIYTHPSRPGIVQVPI